MTPDSNNRCDEFTMSNFSIHNFLLINKLILELRVPVSHPKSLDQCKVNLSVSLQWDLVFSLQHWSSGAEVSLCKYLLIPSFILHFKCSINSWNRFTPTLQNIGRKEGKPAIPQTS